MAAADSGLDHDSYVICEQVRCVARERLVRRVGPAPTSVMARITTVLRVLLEI